MILIDNINYLREKNPVVWERLKPLEDEKSELVTIEDTRKGDKTLVLNKDNKKIYFHSKYDPIREAETIVEEYRDVEEYTNIIFYGTGLGYHIELMLKKHMKNKFYIIEPIPEIMEAFLSTQNLTQSTFKNCLGISIGLEDIYTDIANFIDINRKKVTIVYLPSHKQQFEEQYSKFNEMFLETIKSKRNELSVNYSFQRRWIINSMKNLKCVLGSNNILLEKKNGFINKPALLISAGPSLNDEIENIRYIKDNKLAYLFSVGSSINTLIYNNIYPDVATTYDPTEINQKVFEKVKQECISDIPLIFGSTVGFETLEGYLGKMHHMITSQDKVANYFLQTSDDAQIDIVLDAPSIAVVTLQLMANMGFNPIILVGQNLAFKDKQYYSHGIDYEEGTPYDDVNNKWIEDVYGNQVLTDSGFDRMRIQMELYTSHMINRKVINTTKGGAKIKGTEFLELESIISNELIKPIVEENWLEGSITDYSKEYLQERLDKMDKSLEDAYRWIKEYNITLDKLINLTNLRKFKDLDSLYHKLNISITALELNDFFTTFILQINRVQHKLLADTVKIVRFEKDLFKKNIKLLGSYKGFIEKCSIDIELIKPIYFEMKQDILNYINDDIKEGESNV